MDQGGRWPGTAEDRDKAVSAHCTLSACCSLRSVTETYQKVTSQIMESTKKALTERSNKLVN